MKLLKHGHLILLMSLSVASILLAVADFTGLLHKLEWIPKPNYEVLLLVLFGTMGLQLGVSHVDEARFHESFEGGSKRLAAEFERHAERLVRGVRGVEVKVFQNAAEQELYLAKRIDGARTEVCDLSWKEKLSLHTALPERIKAHKTYESSIARAAKRIPYREVFVFSDPRRKEKLRRRIEENTPGYSCRYFATPCSIPRLQFIIIDREEIVFASSAYPTLCSIRQSELAEIFQSYYESIWNAATPLKEGDTIHHSEVTKVLS